VAQPLTGAGSGFVTASKARRIFCRSPSAIECRHDGVCAIERFISADSVNDGRVGGGELLVLCVCTIAIRLQVPKLGLVGIVAKSVP
jgi:hypothetical protein